MKKGYVYIVGAGPGDPGLITVKGIECIKKADVIIYDRLMNPSLLNKIKPGAELIYAGKSSSVHTIKQHDLNILIAEKAAEGKIVVRLKGGDPYIFGRGGEEALLLHERGIDFEIVPGISAFSAVPAYAGIPVTHRGYTSTAAIITGHEDPSKAESDIDWEKVAGIGTLVFFMGVKNLPGICENLIKYGKNPETKAAVIVLGTTPEQNTIEGTLQNISQLCEQNDVKPPAIFIVSDTVELRNKLNWFEKLPLFGKKIVVTRAREQASELTERLANLGAFVYEVPAIKITEPDDKFESLKKAVDNFENYDIIVFTSINGVKNFLHKTIEYGHDIRILAGKTIAAIGEKTAEELQKHFIKVDIMPLEFRAEELCCEIIKKHGAQKSCPPENILIVRAQQARELLPEKLKEAGFNVNIAHAYKMQRETISDPEILKTIQDGDFDLITFASSGTVLNFIETAGEDSVRNWKNKHVKIAAIGPVTAETCLKYFAGVDIMPSEYTIEAMISEIKKYYQEKKN